MSLLDKFTNEMRIQRELKSQLSDMTYKAFNGTRQSARNFAEGVLNVGTINFKTPDDKITKEMILDYQKSEQERGYINPVSGEKMVYDPIVMGDILAIPKKIVWKNGRVADDKDYFLENERYGSYLQDLQKYEKQMKQAQQDLRKYQILKKKAQKENDASTYASAVVEIAKLERDLKTIAMLTKKKNSDIKNSKSELEIIQDNIDKNKVEEQIAKNENKKLTQKYTEQFNLLNKNRNSISQDPNESEQEYIDRIKTLQNLNFDPNIFKDRAELENKNKLKEKLKEIIKTDSVISDILKSFPANQIYNINKFYPAILKKLVKVYGVKNEFTEYKDYVATINEVLNEVDPKDYTFQTAMNTFAPPSPVSAISATAPMSPVSPVSPVSASSSITAPAGSVSYDPSILLASPGIGPPSPLITPLPGSPTAGSPAIGINFQIINNYTMRIYDATKEIYVRIGHDSSNSTNTVLFAALNTQGQFRRFDFKKASGKYSFKEIMTKFNSWPINDNYRKIFGTTSNKADVYAHLKNVKGLQDTFDVKQLPNDETTGLIAGWGMKNDDVPKTATFGKNIILLHKLFYKNILAIKDAKMHAVEHFPNVKVSDNLADVIINMCKNIKPNKQTLESLKTSEREIFDLLLYVSGLNKKLSTKKENNVNELKERLKLVEAQIRAGNNNPVAKNELKGIVQKLQLYNCISMNNAKNYLRQFN